MKYLLVLLVVGVGIWMLVKRLRSDGGSPGLAERAAPVAMVECAHCGVHLPAADADRVVADALARVPVPLTR